MSQQDPATLLLERQGGVLTIRLNRPERRNAMSQAMLRELLDALAAAEAGGVRVAVLRGSGGHFSAGADLRDMAQAREAPIAHETDPLARANAAFGHVCAAYSQSPLAVVALLEGAVMGGGFGLACCADVAIASHTADFRLPETSLGLDPRADRAVPGRAAGLFGGSAHRGDWRALWSGGSLAHRARA